MTLTQEAKDLLKETFKQVVENTSEIKDLRDDTNELLKSASKKVDVPVSFLRKVAKTYLKSNLTEVEEETREMRDLLNALK